MYPPIFPIASGSVQVRAYLGTNPVRFYPFSRAPGPNEPGYAKPYAVHQLVYGNPENTLSCTPDIDMSGLQVDVYADSAESARDAAMALRDAIESAGNHVVAYNGEEVERETGLYRVGFTAEFWTNRSS